MIFYVIVISIYFMKNQSIDVLEVFINEVEAQLNRKVKIVKFDKSGVYYGRYINNGQCPSLSAKVLLVSWPLQQLNSNSNNDVLDTTSRLLKGMDNYHSN